MQHGYNSHKLPPCSARSLLPRSEEQQLEQQLEQQHEVGFHRFVEEEGEEKQQEQQQSDSGSGSGGTITAWQAAWNVTNAIQGMFMVSMPYSVLHGGVWSLLFVAVAAGICWRTGRMLVECLYEGGDRVRGSYREIADHAMNTPLAGFVVNAAAITEALMTCILYLVLCGDLLSGCFPDLPISSSAWVTLSFVCLLPCCCLTSLQHVSIISFWNTVTHIGINLIIIAYCLTRVNQWQPHKVQTRVDIDTFPISVGIIVFSYTSHIFLPTLEGCLTDRSKFGRMMTWTHVLAAACKAALGYVGFVTFAENTKEEITNNVSSEALKVALNVALVVKALCSYPLPYFAAAKFLESSLFTGWPLPSCWSPASKFRPWAALPRAALVLFTYIVAITVPHFALLCGLIGSFTGTMLSFVWPAYFHLALKRHSSSWAERGFSCVVIVMGLLLGSMGMYFSGCALHRRMSGETLMTHSPNATAGSFILRHA